MNNELMFSSKNSEWETPQDLFDELDREHNFTLDPCCTEKTAKCKKYYTPKENELMQNWTGERVFVNPPYGREIGKWVEKSYKEAKKGCVVVMLIPARTDTRWFHNWIYPYKAEIKFLKGRVKFLESGKQKDAAPFPSMIVTFKAY